MSLVLKKFGFTISIVTVFFLTGCNYQMYKANMINAPAFKEKGEFSGTISTTNFQGALAINDNFGVLANAYYNADGGDLDIFSRDYFTEHFFLETGGGLYKSINDWAVAEIFAGGGLGRVTVERENIRRSPFSGTERSLYL